MNIYQKNAAFFLGVSVGHRGAACCLVERLENPTEYAVRLLRSKRQPDPEWLEAQVLEASEFIKGSKRCLVVSKDESLREWLAKAHSQFDHSAPELEPGTALFSAMGAINSKRVVDIDLTSRELLERELKLLSNNTESNPDLGIVTEALILSLGEACSRDSITKSSPGGVFVGRPNPGVQALHEQIATRHERICQHFRPRSTDLYR